MVLSCVSFVSMPFCIDVRSDVSVVACTVLRCVDDDARVACASELFLFGVV